MILFVMALHCEARPLISRLKLKKVHRPGSFELYSGEDMLLAVGGTGMIRAAGVTGHLLALCPDINDAVIINAGICGASSDEFATGTPVLANKVINMSTERSFYPDILFKHSVREAAVASFTSPVSNPAVSLPSNTAADMEAAGFFETASVFLPPHCIQCVKLVSDHLEGSKLEQSFVSDIVNSAAGQLLEIAYCTKETAAQAKSPFTEQINGMLDAIAEKLMLSETMRHQLRQLSGRYAATHEGSLECLKEFTVCRANSKKEGKVLFEHIRKTLE